MSDIDYFLLQGPAAKYLKSWAGDFIKASHEIPNMNRDSLLTSLDAFFLGESEYEFYLYGEGLDSSEVQWMCAHLNNSYRLPISLTSDTDRCLTRSLQLISTTFLTETIVMQNDWRATMSSGKLGQLMLAVRGIGMKVRST